MGSPESNTDAEGGLPGALTSVEQLHTLESVEDAASAVQRCFTECLPHPKPNGWLTGTVLHQQFHALKPRYKRSCEKKRGLQGLGIPTDPRASSCAAAHALFAPMKRCMSTMHQI